MSDHSSLSGEGTLEQVGAELTSSEARSFAAQLLAAADTIETSHVRP